MHQLKSLNQISDELEQAFVKWTNEPMNAQFSKDYEKKVKLYTQTLEKLKSTLVSVN